MTTLLLLLLSTIAWAQGPDQVSTPQIVFDSADVTTCTGRRRVSGGVSYCTDAGAIVAVGGGTFCGDGVINGTEECDPSATLPTGCASCGAANTGTTACRCVRASTCGNGILEAGPGWSPSETCDPPGTVGAAAGCAAQYECDAGCGSCTLSSPACGDSSYAGSCPGADCCDPPWTQSTCSSGYVCDGQCDACTQCGNGVLDGGEDCDPGDPSDRDPEPVDSACIGGCQLDCTCPTPTCGDRVLSTGEACEPDPLGDTTGYASCQPKDCVAGCRCFCGPESKGGPTDGTCGDGVLQQDCVGLDGGDEECERSSAIVTRDFNEAGYFGSTSDTSGARFQQGSDLAAYDFGAGDFVIEGLIRLDREVTSGQVAWIVGKWTPSTSGWRVAINSSETLRFDCYDGSSDYTCAYPAGGSSSCTTPTITVGSLYHFALTHTGTTTAWYLLNLTTGETAHVALGNSSSGDCDTITDSSDALAIGGRDSSDTFYFPGVIDELRIRTGTGVVSDYTTNQMDQDWDTEVTSCGGTTVLSRWGFNSTSGTTLTDTCGSAGNATLGGNATATFSWLDPSPFSASSSTETYTGCAAGETCDTVTCQCSDTSAASALYVDDTGNDANDGLTASTPLLRFATAAARAVPGTTIYVGNGTYTAATHGDGRSVMPILCSPATTTTRCTGGATCGTAALPITIRATNSRQAVLNNTVGWEAVNVRGCQNWIVDGFVAKGSDVDVSAGTAVVNVEDSDDITVRNTLAYDSNQYENAHLYLANDSSDVVFEQNEGYQYHRHCISLFTSSGGRVSRNYCNSGIDTAESVTGEQGIPALSQDGLKNAGDEAVASYASSGVLIENNIAESGYGFQVHGGTNYLGEIASGAKVLGNICHACGGTDVQFDTRTGTSARVSGAYGLNNVSINSRRATVPMRFSSVVGARFENNTAIGATAIGSGSQTYAFENASTTCTALNTAGYPCSITFRNNASNESDGWGFGLQDITTDYTCVAEANCAVGNTDGTMTAFFESQCSGTELGTCSTLTGFGNGSAETVAFVLATATDLRGDGDTESLADKLCQSGDDAYGRCTSTSNCAGGATCAHDIGANIVCRYEDGSLTRNDDCTAADTPWDCCTGSGTGSCSVWAGLGTQAANDCASTDASSGVPSCHYRFQGCGVIVAGINDTNGASCFDVHERAGINFGAAAETGTVQPPACP